MASRDKRRRRQLGFTLTELAVVLVIVALLIGGMLVPLSAQDEIRRSVETKKTLSEIQDALLGFAAANGRLPCPATVNSNGFESFCQEHSGQPYTSCTLVTPVGSMPASTPYLCSNPYDGFVPAATLGIGPVDSNKLVTDAWGNPIRYAVAVQSNASSPKYDFTTPGGMRSETLARLSDPSSDTYRPDLRVCDANNGVINAGTANGSVGGLADCALGHSLTSSAVAVIYSLGVNAPTGGTSADEKHNPNPNSPIPPDRVYVSHDPTSTTSANGEFDDIVIWLSPNTLYNRMIAAGQLP